MAAVTTSTPGMRRYLYEYMFYRATEMAVPWSNSRLEAQGETPMEPLTVSAARGIRQRLDEVLDEQGLSMDQPGSINLPTLFGAVDEAFGRSMPGRYRPQFTKIVQDGGVKDSTAYRRLSGDFTTLLGMGSEGPTGGTRLPVSPYDPRWTYRDSVQARGPELLAMPMADVQEMLDVDEAAPGGNRGVNRLTDPPSMIAEYTSPQLVSNTPATGSGGAYLREVGPAYTEADAMGLGVLRQYMTDAEFRTAQPWVMQGVSTGGGVDPRKAMSSEALARSVAVLDHLSDNGVNYSIEPDLMPGQLRVRVPDNNLEIRLTDTRRNESWVGRVYSNGSRVQYARGQGMARDQTPITPSPSQTVDLVRFARGEKVQRADGRGVVGDVSVNETSGRRRDVYYRTQGRVLSSKVDDDLFIRIDATRQTPSTSWYQPDTAQNYLTEAVTSARENMLEQVDLDGLIEQHQTHEGDPDFVPDFAGLADVSGLRQSYWNQLVAGEVTLLAPGYSAADEATAMAEGDFAALDDMTLANHIIETDYAGTPEGVDPEVYAALSAHTRLSVDRTIGTFEPDEEGRRFDPVKVSSFMTSATGVWRNNDEIVAALRATGISADELRGDGFYNGVIADRLIEFDESAAVDMTEHDSPLVRRLAERVSDVVGTRGAQVTDLRIDDKGVVSWTAERTVGTSAGRAGDTVTGQMGQILVPGEHGEIVTKLGSGNDYLFAPGYEATVVPQGPGENLSLEQRTRLRGYEAVLGDAIGTQITEGLLSNRSMVGEPTSLNSSVRRLYATRHPADFMERSLEEGMSVADRDALLATESLRVRYSNEMGDGATTLPVMKAEIDRDRAVERDGITEAAWSRNDNGRDPLRLTGGRNMSVLDVEAGAGFFDPVMTGTARNQGLVRYLVPDAEVNADGTITPGSEDGRVPVATSDMAWAMEYDPHDRQNMTFSNIMQASAVAGDVRTAMMQLGGWNFEDGIIVSESFAAEHGLRGTDGEMRELRIGDKLSDFHGNKGVISLVVDPTMDPAEAAEAGLAEQVGFFRDNPDVEVVMSPFSAISRFNGGTARELMDNPSDVVVRDDEGNREVVPGGAGGLNMIVTHMSVDAKTNVYDAEAIAEGRGRKASSQLAWALQAKGCPEIMADFYGSNTSGVTNAREYLLALGLDMSPTGELLDEYDVTTDEDRKAFDMPDAVDGPGKKLSVADFGRQISTSGGFVELPFPLEYPSGDDGETRTTPQAREGVWRLPVLASHLRSEQDLEDGSVSRHDHTVRYMNIYGAAHDWLKAQADVDRAREAVAEITAETGGPGGAEDAEHTNPDLAKAQAKLDEALANQDKAQSKAQASAQTNYNMVSRDIVSRRIESKRNMFRDGLMNNRRPHSATAVWSGDPRLGVNQIAMNSATAAELGVDVAAAKSDAVDPEADSQGRYVMTWRDPVLRDGAVRYMEVVVNDELTGVAVNPVSVKSMDGDFDGDSVGLVGKLSPAAHAEAMQTLTVEANLLDKGVKNPDGSYPLALHNALDTKVAQHADPARAEQLAEIVAQLNTVGADTSISREERTEVNKAYMNDLNEFYRETFDSRSDRVRLRFDSIDSHMSSVAKCYETGAKGSERKLDDYAEYLAVRKEADGHYTDLGHQDRAEMIAKHTGSQKATSYKTELTGVAGARSQAAVQLLRGRDELAVATEITYPVTQAMLQAKHDPVDAAYRAETINGPLRDLWKGRAMSATEVDGRYQWSVLSDSDNRPVQATTEQFASQMEKMIVHDQGMGVPLNMDHVRRAAELLDDGTGRIVDTSRDNWSELSDEQQPLMLDKLAYNGSFNDVLTAARNKEQLFTGANAQFAPSVVSHNQRLAAAEMDGQVVEKEAKVFAAKETAADYRPKVAATELTAQSTRSPIKSRLAAYEQAGQQSQAGAAKVSGGMEL